jgi:tryptophan synthase alpha subunit
VDADQCDALELGVPFDDLVRDPRQRALDVFRIEDSLRFGGLRAAQGTLRALLTFYSFPASRDRVKGACVGAGL